MGHTAVRQERQLHRKSTCTVSHCRVQQGHHRKNTHDGRMDGLPASRLGWNSRCVHGTLCRSRHNQTGNSQHTTNQIHNHQRPRIRQPHQTRKSTTTADMRRRPSCNTNSKIRTTIDDEQRTEANNTPAEPRRDDQLFARQNNRHRATYTRVCTIHKVFVGKQNNQNPSINRLRHYRQRYSHTNHDRA